jgi:DNA end-binding protein Ku
LQRTHVIGIARWSMRKRPYFGALDLFGGHLGISTLHHAEEVIAVESLDVPASRSLQPKEIKLAEQLVGALEDEFDAESFADTYRDRVQELAQAKHSGKRVQLPKAKRRAPTPPSLSEALAKSLEHIKRRRAS